MEQLPLWPRSAAVTTTVLAEPRSVDLPSVERRDAVRLSRWLQEAVGRPVRLELTANRSTMLTSWDEGEVLRLRLHRTFIDAPEEIWRAVVAYVGFDDRQAGSSLDAYIRDLADREPIEPVAVQTRGRVYDLEAIFNEINARFFHDASAAQITWGTASRRRRRRSIQLGCFIARENLIRIHPCLDQAFVPRHYVAWVVFHEMLHEVFGVEGHGGKRRSLHPPEFVAIEQSFPGWEACQLWERQNLDRLLRYRPPPRGRPSA